MPLSDSQKLETALHFGLCSWKHPVDAEPYVFWHADRITAAFDHIEEAATAPLLAQIAALEAWKAKIIKSSEKAYGESAIRYKFSLTKNGKCMNTFPKEIDGRWFALTPAEDDGHIGHIARIAQLEAQIAEARKDAERLDWMIFHSAKVCHGNDAEYCSVKWVEDYEERQTDVYSDSRAAIDAAIAQEQPNTTDEPRPGVGSI